MSELAFNINGEAFDLPAAAAGLRVRRMKPKGAPDVAYGADGLPVILPVDADLDDLRRAVGTPGRYRLDPVDERNRPIPDAQAAYVHVTAESRTSTPTASSSATAGHPSIEAALVDIVRINGEVMKVMAEKMGGMLAEGATLLAAADAAGLPRREPMAVGYEEEEGDEGEEDEGEGTARPGNDLRAVIDQLMPMLQMLGMRLMGGKAADAVEPITSERKPAALSSGDDEGDEPMKRAKPSASEKKVKQRSTDPTAHFLAIQGRLTAEEQTFVQGVIARLAMPELMQWRDQLSQLSVDDAVALLRAEIAKTKEKAS